MKKLLLMGVLLTITAYATFKVWVWYQADQLLKGWKQTYAADMALSYRWIYSSLEGEIGVTGVTLTPFGLKESFEIGDVKLKFANVFDLISLDRLAAGTFPEQLRLIISNASLRVRDVTFADVGQIGTGDRRFDFLALPQCGTLNRFGGIQLQSLGLNALTSRIEIGYRRRPLADNLVLDAVWNVDDVASISVEAELDLPSMGWSWPALVQLLNKPQKAAISLHDRGLTRRLALVCGERTGFKRPELAMLISDGWLGQLRSIGIDMAPGWQQLLGGFIAEGGVMSLVFTPAVAFNRLQWQERLADQLLTDMGMQVHLNGKRMSNLGWKFDAASYALLWNKTPEPVAAKPVAVKKAPAPRWRDAQLTQLATLVGQAVRIVLVNGRSLEGTLSNVSEFSLEVSQQLSSGQVAYPLRKEEVAILEVWQ